MSEAHDAAQGRRTRPEGQARLDSDDRDLLMEASGVGPVTADRIAAEFDSLAAVIQDCVVVARGEQTTMDDTTAARDRLTAVNGIGETRVDSLAEEISSLAPLTPEDLFDERLGSCAQCGDVLDPHRLASRETFSIGREGRSVRQCPSCGAFGAVVHTPHGTHRLTGLAYSGRRSGRAELSALADDDADADDENGDDHHPDAGGVDADTLRELRDRSGLSQYEVADLAGVSRSSVYHAEQGRDWVTDNVRSRLLRALRKSGATPDPSGTRRAMTDGGLQQDRVLSWEQFRGILQSVMPAQAEDEELFLVIGQVAPVRDWGALTQDAEINGHAQGVEEPRTPENLYEQPDPTLVTGDQEQVELAQWRFPTRVFDGDSSDAVDAVAEADHQLLGSLPFREHAVDQEHHAVRPLSEVLCLIDRIRGPETALVQGALSLSGTVSHSVEGPVSSLDGIRLPSRLVDGDVNALRSALMAISGTLIVDRDDLAADVWRGGEADDDEPDDWDSQNGRPVVTDGGWTSDGEAGPCRDCGERPATSRTHDGRLVCDRCYDGDENPLVPDGGSELRTDGGVGIGEDAAAPATSLDTSTYDHWYLVDEDEGDVLYGPGTVSQVSNETDISGRSIVPESQLATVDVSLDLVSLGSLSSPARSARGRVMRRLRNSWHDGSNPVLYWEIGALSEGALDAVDWWRVVADGRLALCRDLCESSRPNTANWAGVGPTGDLLVTLDREIIKSGRRAVETLSNWSEADLDGYSFNLTPIEDTPLVKRSLVDEHDEFESPDWHESLIREGPSEAFDALKLGERVDAEAVRERDRVRIWTEDLAGPLTGTVVGRFDHPRRDEYDVEVQPDSGPDSVDSETLRVLQGRQGDLSLTGTDHGGSWKTVVDLGVVKRLDIIGRQGSTPEETEVGR